MRAHDDGIGLPDADESPDLACEGEGVAGAHSEYEMLLDLADQPAALHAHLQHGLLDDRARIHAEPPYRLVVGNAQPSLAVRKESSEPFIGVERKTAGGDVVDDAIEEALDPDRRTEVR